MWSFVLGLGGLRSNLVIAPQSWPLEGIAQVIYTAADQTRYAPAQGSTSQTQSADGTAAWEAEAEKHSKRRDARN